MYGKWGLFIIKMYNVFQAYVIMIYFCNEFKLIISARLFKNELFQALSYSPVNV